MQWVCSWNDMFFTEIIIQAILWDTELVMWDKEGTQTSKDAEISTSYDWKTTRCWIVE